MDKLLETEIILSREFILSSQEMFGGSYRAIVRHLITHYGKGIIQSVIEEKLDFTDLSDEEKIKTALENLFKVEFVKVDVGEDAVTIWNKECGHHLDEETITELGLEGLSTCPITILEACAIEIILERPVLDLQVVSPGPGCCHIEFHLVGK